jgi:hypothetical protein
MQRCTDLALLLLGGDPELFAPCSVGEGSVTGRKPVRLAPPVEGKDLVLPKPEGFKFEAGSGSIPYTTEIRPSDECLEKQDAKVVDTVVRMFMAVVCFSEDIFEDDMEMMLALWEVRSFCIE